MFFDENKHLFLYFLQELQIQKRKATMTDVIFFKQRNYKCSIQYSSESESFYMTLRHQAKLIYKESLSDMFQKMMHLAEEKNNKNNQLFVAFESKLMATAMKRNFLHELNIYKVAQMMYVFFYLFAENYFNNRLEDELELDSDFSLFLLDIYESMNEKYKQLL